MRLFSVIVFLLPSSVEIYDSGDELDEMEAVPLGIVMTLTLKRRFARASSQCNGCCFPSIEDSGVPCSWNGFIRSLSPSYGAICWVLGTLVERCDSLGGGGNCPDALKGKAELDRVVTGRDGQIVSVINADDDTLGRLDMRGVKESNALEWGSSKWRSLLCWTREVLYVDVITSLFDDAKESYMESDEWFYKLHRRSWMYH